MSKDSNRTYVHLNQPRIADLFEEFCRDHLPDEEVYIPPQYQPLNPEEEDDVVPDQHAAFGITRAQQTTREPVWKDLGLEALMKAAPKDVKVKSKTGGSSSKSRLPR